MVSWLIEIPITVELLDPTSTKVDRDPLEGEGLYRDVYQEKGGRVGGGKWVVVISGGTSQY